MTGGELSEEAVVYLQGACEDLEQRVLELEAQIEKLQTKLERAESQRAGSPWWRKPA